MGVPCHLGGSLASPTRRHEFEAPRISADEREAAEFRSGYVGAEIGTTGAALTLAWFGVAGGDRETRASGKTIKLPLPFGASSDAEGVRQRAGTGSSR